MKKVVNGGYIVITVGQLASVCAARREKRISFAALRVYLAAFELVAKRCTAKGKVRFEIREVSRLLGGVGEKTIFHALRELKHEELLSWSESSIEFSNELSSKAQEIVCEFGTSSKRPVPIPRRLLRALVRHTKPSEVIAAIAHCVRCLFKKGREITSKGFLKASWVARVFGIAERAVYSARQWLISLEFLVPVKVHQLVMNRWGACFTINTKQTEQKNPPQRPTQKPESAPLKNYNPLKRIINSKNQKPVSRKAGFLSKNPGKPSLKDIQLEDLKRVSRVEELYHQAVMANWLPDCEANLRNFVSAAIRATRVSGDSVRIFVGIVRRGLWHHITHEQEDRATQALKRYREKQAAAKRSGQVSALVAGLLASGLA